MADHLRNHGFILNPEYALKSNEKIAMSLKGKHKHEILQMIKDGKGFRHLGQMINVSHYIKVSEMNSFDRKTINCGFCVTRIFHGWENYYGML